MRVWFWIVMIGFGLQACAAQPQKTLTVFAAASLNTSFEELRIAFIKQHPDVDIVFNFAGSQQLAQQLIQGAPADVFVSANLNQMNLVSDSGLINPSSLITVTTNSLIIITPPDNPAKITDLRDLAKPGVQLILAAEAVPAGAYAREVLTKASTDYGPAYIQAVEHNIVSNEQHVRAVLTKIQLGEADAGIVYHSDPGSQSPVYQITIPDTYNIDTVYPLAILRSSQQQQAAQVWSDWLQTPEAQTILASYGFGMSNFGP